MASTQVTELNVGGHCFTTLRSTLCKHEDSMLSKMFSGDLKPAHQDAQGRFFIDRDGTHFGSVLAYLRGQPVQFPVGLAERSALAAEASFYQLQGLQKMLELDHTGPNDDSDLTFECLGRLHINHGDALLQQHARAQIQPHKLQNISEALTRFYFGERGQSSSTPAATQQEKKLRLFGQLSANARVKAAFTLYKEHIGYGGQLVRYPWSTLMSHKGYADSWRLANISQSPLLVDIDADELVHLLYTYAVVFQTEMERRGLKLSLQCPEPRAIREGSALLQSEHLRFSVTLSAICLV